LRHRLPYLPDLAPDDFDLFPNLQKCLVKIDNEFKAPFSAAILPARDQSLIIVGQSVLQLMEIEVSVCYFDI
jgi:hypothetical protein